MDQPSVEISRSGIPIETDPDLSLEGFCKLGYFRLADAVGAKTIEKHFQDLKEKQRHMG
jgi:hypothetical protein